jgi:hypothetical protein
MVRTAEQQISEIEELQHEEQEEIRHINSKQKDLEQQLQANCKVGHLQRQLAEVEDWQQNTAEEPLRIHEGMNPREINEILNDHHRLNEDILERASRARSREGKPSLSSTQAPKLSKTLKKATAPPKSVVNTYSHSFHGKKGKR